MPGTDHIKQYSAADIQLYLDGKMSPAEMHALEQAALDDPFLADAIEGMQETLVHHDANLIEAHLWDIHQKIEDRTRKQSSGKTRVIAFRWWQVAAAAVVVVTGSLWGYNYFQQKASAVAAQDQLAIAKQESYRKTAPAVDSSPVAASEHVPSTAARETTDSAIADHFTQDQLSSNIASQKAEEKSPTSLDTKVTWNGTAKAKDQAAAPDNAFYFQPQKNAAADLQEKYSLSEVKIDSAKLGVALRQLKKDNAVVTYNSKPTDNTTFNKVSSYSNSVDKVLKNKPLDYEQIVVSKPVRDTTSSYAFYTKPREQEMNRSRKELSEKQAKKNPDALLSGFISGRVTDQSNNPISNALLRVENNRDFFTDQKGQFKIPVNDSIVNVAVGVSGYYTQNLQLQNNTDNNIALNQLGVKAPNPQLNGGIENKSLSLDSMSLADGKAKAVALSRSNLDLAAATAHPQYGWPAYQQYLEKNKKLSAGTPEPAGTVIVSFQVNKKGTLSDFKIEQSLGKVYDDEAIRLIKAGPSWKLANGRKAKATVIVHF